MKNTPNSALFISHVKLRDLKDLHRLKTELDNGNILFVDTAPFFHKFHNDMMVLRQTINDLHQVVIRKGGSVGRIGKKILVLSPLKQVQIL